MKVGK